MRRFYNTIVFYVVPCLALMSVGILIHNYGSLSVPSEYMFGVICTGNIRAVSMILLGVFLNEFSERIQVPKSRGLILSIGELLLYCFILYYMHIWNESIGYYDALCVLAMFFALGITLTNYSALRIFSDSNVARFLGKFSVPLFLNHYYWVQNVDTISFFPLGQLTNKQSGMLMSFVTAAFVMALTSFIYFIKKRNSHASKS